MPIDERWDAVDDKQWSSLAGSWLAELDDDCDPIDSDFAQKVTWLMFTGRPQQLWTFILLAIEHAVTDVHLEHIAGGPVERLLGRYGSDFIDLVERHAHSDPKFARMLTGVSRYEMTENTWNRVKALQQNCADSLDANDAHCRFIELEELHLAKLKAALNERRSTS